MTTKHRCTKCGGFNVYNDAWVGINDASAVLGPYDAAHCEDCEGECNTEEVEMIELETDTVRAMLDYIENATLEGDPLPEWFAEVSQKAGKS